MGGGFGPVFILSYFLTIAKSKAKKKGPVWGPLFVAAIVLYSCMASALFRRSWASSWALASLEYRSWRSLLFTAAGLLNLGPFLFALHLGGGFSD